MIKVKNLSKSYIHNGKKINIFRNLNFEIKKGESIALLGRNGAGKSTLLKILGGIDHPDSGSVQRDCSISWPVGLVGGFQGSLSARENTIFVSKIYAGQYDAQTGADNIAAAWDKITDQIGRENQIKLYKASLGM